MGKPGARVDQAATALAHTRGFSDEERAAIITLISDPTRRNHSVEHAYVTVLRDMGPRDFDWPEFDRWYTVFSKRGLFPPLWEGLQNRPCPDAPSRIRQAYLERKLYLLLDWLHGLMATRAEMRAALARYALRGLGAQIARQRADVTCPACDRPRHEDLQCTPERVPPFHPGCRCLILATVV
jgi:hypothetical protein